MYRPKYISLKKRRLILEKTNGVCYYCGCKIKEDDFHVDHFIPIAKGGTNDFENLVPSCKICNQAKCEYTIEEFRGKIYKALDTASGRLLGQYFHMSPKFTGDYEFWFERNK